MKITINIRRWAIAVLMLAGVWISDAVFAQEPSTLETAETPGVAEAPDYTKKGADTCIKCHDEDSEFPVFSIFKTKHAQPGDPRSPFAGLQCEACHGPGDLHAQRVRKGETRAPIITFGATSKLSEDKQNPVTVEKRNQICLGCHQGGARMAWNTSAHQGNELACTNCHQVHTPHDAVLTTTTQPEVCFNCHRKQRTDFLKSSVHPVRFGQMTCSDCHNVHGSNTHASLSKPTLNQTCYTCHAEKRGPVLWEHAPVSEDCTICHTPHGSIHPALLVKQPPLLCQQCHSQFGHPSIPRDSGGLAGGSPSGFLLSGACLNCHSQIHGSNHPSGVMLMR